MPDPARKRPHPLVKLAVELGPLIVFFVVFSRWGIYAATGTFMVTSVLALGYAWVTEHRIPPMPLVTAVIVLVLGGLTLWLHDETFVKLKLTVVSALFALILLAGLVLRKPLVKHVLGEALRLTDEGWRIVTCLWIGYFVLLGALNEVVWRNTSTENWVRFKTFAVPALPLVFILLTTPLIARYEEAETPAPDEPPPA